MSGRLGTSIEQAQRWQAVARQTSTDVESFGASAYQLQQRVASGSAEVRQATADLNLEYGKLRAMAPDDYYNAVIKALEGVEDITERNRLGQALFGRTFADIAVAVSEGYTKISTSARVASDDQVRAAEAAGQAWEDMKAAAQDASLFVVGTASQWILDSIASATVDLESLTRSQRARVEAIMAANQGDGLHALVESFARERTKDIALTDRQSTAQDQHARALAGATAEARRKAAAEREAAKVADEHTRALDRQRQILANANFSDYMKRLTGEDIRADVAELSREISNSLAAWSETGDVIRIGPVLQSTALLDTTVELKPAIRSAMDEFDRGGKEVEKLADRIRTSLGPAILGAFQGGGRPGRSIGGALLGAVFSEGGGPEQAVSGFLQKVFKGGVGTFLSSMVPGLGVLIGGKLGDVIGAKIGGIFGHVSEEVKEARKDVAAFQADLTKTLTPAQRLEAGTEQWRQTVVKVRDAYLATGRTAAEAEAIVRQLWNTNDPEAAAAAMQRINEVLQEQAEILAANKETANKLFDQIIEAGADGIPAAYQGAIDQLIALGLLTDEQIEKLQGLGAATVSTRKMEEAFESLGGKIGELGPIYQQAKINETALKHINAIEYLTKHGEDLGKVLGIAANELGDLVAQAKRGGLTLPSNMRPWVEQLMATGQLIDSNGQKITDLGGINWGAEMETEGQKAQKTWDKILAAIERLVGFIAGPLEGAIDRVTRDRTVDVDVNFRERREGNSDGQEEPERGPGLTGSSGLPPIPPITVPGGVTANDVSTSSALTAVGRGGVTTASVTTNNQGLVGVVMGQSLSPEEIGRQAVDYLARTGLPLNRAGVTDAIQRVVADWMLTYGPR